MTQKEVKIDFFVIGAARCGTTSLYHYLKQHQQVFLPNIKELNHFSRVESLDKEDYELPKEETLHHTKIVEDIEAYSALFHKAKSGQRKGDISPSYLWKKETARRIYEHNPDAKIIVSLRNPVHRAFSHYLMNVAVGYESLEGFEAALKADKNEIWGGGNLYLEWSSYFEGLNEFIKYFGRENVLILLFEDWIKNKPAMLTKLFSFLEINTDVHIDLEEQFNQKKGYKHLKTLNFFRNPKLKQPLKKIFPKALIGSLKELLFKPQDIDEQLSQELSESLHASFYEEVEQLQELTQLPLLKKWGFTEQQAHD